MQNSITKQYVNRAGSTDLKTWSVAELEDAYILSLGNHGMSDLYMPVYEELERRGLAKYREGLFNSVKKRHTPQCV